MPINEQQDREITFISGGAYTQLENASYMDFSSWRSNAAGPPTGGVQITGPVVLNVALVLDRAEDPTALLASDWATRQNELSALNENGTLWTKYGADAGDYAQVLTELQALGIKTIDQLSAETGIANGYVSSAASRTIWVQVTQDSFSTLFGPQAHRASQYVVMVGGTSLSTVGAAKADATLADVTHKAIAGDLDTLWKLAAGGLV